MNAERQWCLIMLLLLCPVAALGVDLGSQQAMDMSKGFVELFEVNGPFHYELNGGAAEKGLFLRWGKKKGLTRTILVWSAEVDKKQGISNEIWIKQMETKRKIKATGIRKVVTGGLVAYTAWADLEGADWQEGTMFISGISSAPKRFKGAALLQLYKRGASKKRVVAYVGLNRCRPGEMYTLNVSAPGTSGLVEKVSVVGGAGKKGNGSSNSVNGMTLSGEDDWDGSSGEQWDVDTFNTRRFKLSGKDGLTWSVDPLLQWIYPSMFVVQFDQTQERGEQ